MPPILEKKRAIKDDLFLALRLAWDFGWIIAIPVVALGFGGAYLDKYLGTSPIFLLIGMVVAVGLSGWGLWRKLREILK